MPEQGNNNSPNIHVHVDRDRHLGRFLLKVGGAAAAGAVVLSSLGSYFGWPGWPDLFGGLDVGQDPAQVEASVRHDTYTIEGQMPIDFGCTTKVGVQADTHAVQPGKLSHTPVIGHIFGDTEADKVWFMDFLLCGKNNVLSAESTVTMGVDRTYREDGTVVSEVEHIKKITVPMGNLDVEQVRVDHGNDGNCISGRTKDSEKTILKKLADYEDAVAKARATGKDGPSCEDNGWSATQALVWTTKGKVASPVVLGEQGGQLAVELDGDPGDIIRSQEIREQQDLKAALEAKFPGVEADVILPPVKSKEVRQAEKLAELKPQLDEIFKPGYGFVWNKDKNQMEFVGEHFDGAKITIRVGGVAKPIPAEGSSLEVGPITNKTPTPPVPTTSPTPTTAG